MPITENLFYVPMKHFTLIVVFFCLIWGIVPTAVAQNAAIGEPCGTKQVQEIARKRFPNLDLQTQQYERQLQEILRQTQQRSSQDLFDNRIIEIPVVFHVLYNNDEQNIPDSLIYSQMDVINEDFMLMNADTINIPDYFRPIAGKARIQFCLATRDPEGNPTTGITRTHTNISQWATSETSSEYDVITQMQFTDSGGHDIWDRNHYLNIWVCNLSSQSSVLAWAYLPGADPLVDGIVCRYNYLGKPTLAGSPYQTGRTLTHEIGHWFNLWHTFDNNDSGCSDDFVEDTPSQAGPNFQCNPFPYSTCGNVSDMFTNYMDYGDEVCGKNLFSKGQVNRMRASIYLIRNALLQSLACQPTAEIDAQPSKVISPGDFFCFGSMVPVAVEIKNTGTAPLTSLRIDYAIDGQWIGTETWTGALLSGQTTNKVVGSYDAGSGVHKVKIWTSLPNNTNDPYTEGDTLTQVYSVDKGMDIPYTQQFDEVVFDTGWKIKDQVDAVPWQQADEVVQADGTTGGVMGIKHDFHSYFEVIGSFDELVSPTFNLGNIENAKLIFDYSYQYLSGHDDRLQVLIANNCNGQATNVYEKQGQALETRDEPTPRSATDWGTDTVDLANYDGQYIVVRFKTITDGGSFLFVDNVRLVGDVIIGTPITVSSNNIRLSPNPVQGNTVYLQWDKALQTPTQVQVWNTCQQQCLEQTIPTGAMSAELHIEHLPAGIYCVRVANTVYKVVVL